MIRLRRHPARLFDWHVECPELRTPGGHVRRVRPVDSKPAVAVDAGALGATTDDDASDWRTNEAV